MDCGSDGQVDSSCLGDYDQLASLNGKGTNRATVAADATYGNGEFLQWLMERDITPYDAHA